MRAVFERDDFVKICGVTSIDDALTARSVGADAVGLIFAESKRKIDLERASSIVKNVDGILRVGVFRGNDDSFVLNALDVSGVDAVQLHDAISEELLDALRSRRVLVIKALSTSDSDFVTFDEARVDAVLVDGPMPGSGQAHEWPGLRERAFKVPVIVAGGLYVDNVGAIIVQQHPWGVDVSTGVESGPGVKDPERVNDFVARARAAFSKGRG